MGSTFKETLFEEAVGRAVGAWASGGKSKRKERAASGPAEESQTQMHKMATESPQNAQISEQAIVVIEETTTSVASELPAPL
jgi:hypothetical protein